MEKARTIRIDASLEKNLWAKLVSTIHHFAKIGKMDPRCCKGVLVGFDEEMKSYRIWDPETRKVVCSRDVLFTDYNDDTGEIFYDKFEASESTETGNSEDLAEPATSKEADQANNIGAGGSLNTEDQMEPTINQEGDMRPISQKTD